MHSFTCALCAEEENSHPYNTIQHKPDRMYVLTARRKLLAYFYFVPCAEISFELPLKEILRVNV